MEMHNHARPIATALAAAVVIALTGCGPDPSVGRGTPPVAESLEPAGAAERFAELEERYDATVGVYAVDTASGQAVEYRADDRFGFASTIKAFAAAAVLDNAATEAELHDPIQVEAEDMVTYSPIIEHHVGGTVTLLEAADAAVRFSDNTAANLLIEYLGGPGAFQEQLRDAGDNTTRIDRIEPDLNDVAPGDERDTSTPRALATSLARYAIGDALNDADRVLLVDMLKNNTTGDNVIRAGAPDGWVIGDKTGTAAYGTRNDIAIAWPPSGGAPIVLAVLSNRAEADADPVDELLAEASSVVFDHLRAN